MKTDYEIEGCWAGLKIKTKCRVCGTLLTPVPKTEHFNSHYWELQRHDAEQLVCCPNDCSVIIAENKIKEYLKIKPYCTSNSESWNYKLNYNTIHNAWIDRNGKIFPCEYREHINLAYELNSDERTLEKRGWLKLSALAFMWQKKLSKKQINIICDYVIIYNKKLMKDFKEKIDYPIGVLELEKENEMYNR